MKPYRISELARKYVDYDMIQKHTELPELSEPRLRVLYAFLNQQQAVSKHSELFTLVVSLVQLGMDTHDLIDTVEEKQPESDMRSRQLKVLAGDYFSASFYQLLAQAGQIEMISRISGAVCEVNRLKVNLYVRMRQLKVTAEDYLLQAVELRSTLFQLFSDVLEGEISRTWSELLSGISRCEVVLDEMQRSETPSRFERSWAYWYVLQVGTDEERQLLMERPGDPVLIQTLVEKYNLRKLLSAKLKQATDAFMAAVSKLGADHVNSEMLQIVDSLLNKKAAYMPALNETR
ncbi:Heptaprenyl diphosphate synthase component 1 [compost metagenome]